MPGSPARSRTSSSAGSRATRRERGGSSSMAEDRFARTAERFVARQDERAAELAERVRVFVGARGDERALDVGCGAGALALALAPLVREVVGVDRVPELPELVLAELVRVTRPGGRVLVIDQLAPVDPLDAIAVDRFERARDSGHARLLPEADLRHLFEANGLVLLRERRDVERRELSAYLDLAGCEGEARERAVALAPEGPEAYTAVLGWYLLERRLP